MLFGPIRRLNYLWFASFPTFVGASDVILRVLTIPNCLVWWLLWWNKIQCFCHMNSNNTSTPITIHILTNAQTSAKQNSTGYVWCVIYPFCLFVFKQATLLLDHLFCFWIKSVTTTFKLFLCMFSIRICRYNSNP